MDETFQCTDEGEDKSSPPYKKTALKITPSPIATTPAVNYDVASTELLSRNKSKSVDNPGVSHGGSAENNNPLSSSTSAPNIATVKIHDTVSAPPPTKKSYRRALKVIIDPETDPPALPQQQLPQQPENLPSFETSSSSNWYASLRTKVSENMGARYTSPQSQGNPFACRSPQSPNPFRRQNGQPTSCPFRSDAGGVTGANPFSNLFVRNNNVSVDKSTEDTSSNVHVNVDEIASSLPKDANTTALPRLIDSSVSVPLSGPSTPSNPDDVRLHALHVDDRLVSDPSSISSSMISHTSLHSNNNALIRSNKRFKPVHRSSDQSPTVRNLRNRTTSGSETSPLKITKQLLDSLEVPPSVRNTPRYGRCEDLNNVTYKFGVCASQGQRNSMEDRYCVLGNLGSQSDCSYYAVFDGHGGSSAASFCEGQMDSFIAGSASFPSEESMREGYSETDLAFQNTERQLEDRDQLAGSTAVTVVVQNSTVWVANVGDSRALLIRADGTFKQLTKDHKPDQPEEMQRIIDAGFTVESKRVNNVLSMSRAIGHKKLKAGVISEPDVVKFDVTSQDIAIVLGSDGLWDFLSNNTVVEIIRCCDTVHHAASRSVAAATAAHSNDDVTVLVIDLQNLNLKQ